MAVFALLNEMFTINSVDLSDHVTQAVLAVNADDLDATAMSSGGWKVHLGGLKGGQIQVDFLDDFALSSVDATLWPLLGTITTFEVRPVNSARSTTNPAYTGSLLVAQFGMGGQLNTVAKKSLTFQTSGTVQRQTS